MTERFEMLPPPVCKTCGRIMGRLGLLPKVDIHPLVYVYKCSPCGEIASLEPGE